MELRSLNLGMEETDLAAIGRVIAGDSNAFGLLVERHSRSVFRLAYRITSNESDAEEVVQEAFLRAFREIRRYESRASFSTWSEQSPPTARWISFASGNGL